ncbi:MAG: hypothetical protein JWM47_1889 [Acidimicrobiales bacterium]|nr:hypothetical protein [Acidimicrobiales bacterium]
MTDSWEFDHPGRFTVGALGEPGSRVFYFQAFAEGVEVAVKCEKQQAVALAEHLMNLLADLPGDQTEPVPPAEALPPTELSWTVGSISIGVDHTKARLVVLLEELLIDEEDDEPLTRDPSRLRVHLTREQVLGLAHQVQALAAAARPICRLCEQPIDPDGHACARLN